jgi:hypothetical protein
LPKTRSGKNAAVVFMNRLTKVVAATTNIGAEELAQLCLDAVVKLHGVPETIISDRDPRFASTFWQQVMTRIGTYPEKKIGDEQPRKVTRSDAAQVRLKFGDDKDDE